MFSNFKKVFSQVSKFEQTLDEMIKNDTFYFSTQDVIYVKQCLMNVDENITQERATQLFNDKMNQMTEKTWMQKIKFLSLVDLLIDEGIFIFKFRGDLKLYSFSGKNIFFLEFVEEETRKQNEEKLQQQDENQKFWDKSNVLYFNINHFYSSKINEMNMQSTKQFQSDIETEMMTYCIRYSLYIQEKVKFIGNVNIFDSYQNYTRSSEVWCKQLDIYVEFFDMVSQYFQIKDLKQFKGFYQCDFMRWQLNQIFKSLLSNLVIILTNFHFLSYKILEDMKKYTEPNQLKLIEKYKYFLRQILEVMQFIQNVLSSNNNILSKQNPNLELFFIKQWGFFKENLEKLQQLWVENMLQNENQFRDVLWNLWKYYDDFNKIMEVQYKHRHIFIQCYRQCLFEFYHFYDKQRRTFQVQSQQQEEEFDQVFGEFKNQYGGILQIQQRKSMEEQQLQEMLTRTQLSAQQMYQQQNEQQSQQQQEQLQQQAQMFQASISDNQDNQ